MMCLGADFILFMLLEIQCTFYISTELISDLENFQTEISFQILPSALFYLSLSRALIKYVKSHSAFHVS